MKFALIAALALLAADRIHAAGFISGETHQEVAASFIVTEPTEPFAVIVDGQQKKTFDAAAVFVAKADAGASKDTGQGPFYLVGASSSIESSFTSLSLDISGRAQAFAADSFPSSRASAEAATQVSVRFQVDQPYRFLAAGDAIPTVPENVGGPVTASLSVVGGETLFSTSFAGGAFASVGTLAPGTEYLLTFDVLQTNTQGEGIPYALSLGLTAIPEPAAAAAIAGIGCLVLGLWRRKTAA